MVLYISIYAYITIYESIYAHITLCMIYMYGGAESGYGPLYVRTILYICVY